VRIELFLQLPALDVLPTNPNSISMTEGTIARITDRGFGFISVEGKDKDLFFHSKDLVGVAFDDLREGDKVSFEITESPKGPNATNVSRI
jgi:CspA family cold shock protein